MKMKASSFTSSVSKKIFIVLFVLALSILQSKACLNYYYTLDREGNFHEADDILVPFNKNFNKELNVQKLKKLSTKLNTEKSYMLLSDYSVALMKLGKQKEALDLLAELYRYYPGEYKIASNLGTAYELNGQNDSALKYIRRGLQLNPNDHEGSEWVHVKILESKIELSKNPSYLTDHTILDLTEQQKKDSMVRKQITIQVRERFPFTPAPDAVMASILTDLGDCCANTSSIEYAKAIYQIANEYYGANSPALENKIKEMQKLVNKYLNKRPQDRHGEGEVSKLGTVKYTTLIDDNDQEHYQVNWDKINTDVKSLLSMVDLTMTVPQANTQANNNSVEGDSAQLKFVNDNTSETNAAADSAVPNPGSDTGKPLTYLFSFFATIIVIVGGAFFIIKALSKR